MRSIAMACQPNEMALGPNADNSNATLTMDRRTVTDAFMRWGQCTHLHAFIWPVDRVCSSVCHQLLRRDLHSGAEFFGDDAAFFSKFLHLMFSFSKQEAQLSLRDRASALSVEIW